MKKPILISVLAIIIIVIVSIILFTFKTNNQSNKIQENIVNMRLISPTFNNNEEKFAKIPKLL